MLISNVIIFIIIICAMIVSCMYNKDFIKNEESKDLKIPLALWLVDKLKIAEHTNNKVRTKLANLSVYKNVNDVIRMHYCKKISLILAVILVCNIICICDNITKKENVTNYIKTLQRPKYGQDDKEVELDVKIADEEKKLNVSITANQLSEDERKVLFDNVKNYIYKELLNDNDSYHNITKKLNLVNSYPEDENIEISWILDESNCVDEKGYVKNEDKLIEITALVDYFDYEEKYQIPLHIKKSNEVEKDEICEKIADDITKQNENYSKDGEIILPDSVDEVLVSYKQGDEKKAENISYFIIILCVVACIAILFFKDKEIDEKMNARKESLMINYPEVLNKFAMLISAGFTIKKAWAKICFEYMNDKYNTNIYDNTQEEMLLGNYFEEFKDVQKKLHYTNDKINFTKNLNNKDDKGNLKKQKKKKRGKSKKEKKINYIYEEMTYTLKEMYGGKSEIDAYEDFGKRVGLIQYMKLSSLFIQNIVSGVSDIVNILELEALEAHKEKKECIKQYGEKIGTKMLIPIIGLLIVTLTIIVIPIMLVSL